MQDAQQRRSGWIPLAIFGLTGSMIGLAVGGWMASTIGLCTGACLGFFVPLPQRPLGYTVSVAVLCLSAASLYSTATLPEYQEAQRLTIQSTLPTGSSFHDVYHFLKSRNAVDVRTARVDGGTSVSAFYDVRYLTCAVRMRTRFVFDRHARLTDVDVTGQPDVDDVALASTTRRR